MIQKQHVLSLLWKQRGEWLADGQLSNDIKLAIRLFASELAIDINGMADLPPETTKVEVPVEIPAKFVPCSLDEIEKQHILAMLEYKNWNKSETARMLDIERSTLDRKLNAYGIKRPD